eukprot:TRINITY_DN5676_c0_g1_i1.p1 TRINITY_DN5676_c0_g1~~TRINITY_DN5676_c0_g1_i1.p1  ORF type:complete len:676 (-),score=89.56 TRINITY_DN5676_c0_g1_i1:157-2184(-)
MCIRDRVKAKQIEQKRELKSWLDAIGQNVIANVLEKNFEHHSANNTDRDHRTNEVPAQKTEGGNFTSTMKRDGPAELPGNVEMPKRQSISIPDLDKDPQSQSRQPVPENLSGSSKSITAPSSTRLEKRTGSIKPLPPIVARPPETRSEKDKDSTPNQTRRSQPNLAHNFSIDTRFVSSQARDTGEPKSPHSARSNKSDRSGRGGSLGSSLVAPFMRGLGSFFLPRPSSLAPPTVSNLGSDDSSVSGSDLDSSSFQGREGKRRAGTVTAAFVLGRTKQINRQFSVNAPVANALIQKVAQKKETKAFLGIPSLIKMISMIYVEKIKQKRDSQNYMNPLHVLTYDILLNKYGLAKVAETKYLQFMESCSFFRKNLLIKAFCKFSRIFDPLDTDDFNFYINCFKSFDDSGTGMTILSNLTETLMLSFKTVNEILDSKFKSFFGADKIDHLTNELTRVVRVELNPKGAQRIEIDLSVVLEALVKLNIDKRNEVKEHVQEVFFAADLDENEIIECYEFLTLCRHLEKGKFNQKMYKQLYFSECDLMIDSEKVMSLNKFAAVSLSQGLFSSEIQDKFATDILQSDSIKTIKDLESEWNTRKRDIKLRLLKAKSYSPILQSFIKKLEKALFDEKKSRKVVWLGYRLLDEESKRLFITHEVNHLLSKDLRFLDQHIEELLETLE